MRADQPHKISNSFKIVLVLFSGICFYFGFGLAGNLGWLMWIAPIPVLYLSLCVKPAQAFGIAFMAYLIGKLSWLSYFLHIMPSFLAIVFTLLLPLIFALTVIAARKIVLKSNHWISAGAFPILFTAVEYALFIFSRDGTAGSIAYTQSNYLPVIQIASVTGILGITFLISFIPSGIALILFFKSKNQPAIQLSGILIFVFAFTCIYGWIRLHRTEKGKSISVALVSIDETAYKGVYGHDASKEEKLTELYLTAVSRLAGQGVHSILIPEKAIIVNDSTINSVLQRFAQIAVSRYVQIIIGGTEQKTGFYFNTAWVISNQGNILAAYKKVNLFEGEVMDGCKPGNPIGIYSQDSVHEGVAICKDMDFQQFILGYNKMSPAILYVPAWDFIEDGWLHARMAILRSVEGGFSLVRNARQGRLTISDWRGKIIAESISESGILTELIGKLTVEPHPTIYARAGDWFGTLNMFAALGLLIYMFKGRKSVG